MFYFFLFFLFGFAQAQSVETFIKGVQSVSDSKQMAQQKALNEVSREVVVKMIGKEKYQKEKKKIEKYIIKNQNRYILSAQSSQPILQDDGNFFSAVTVRVSPENLKNLLLEHNLFYVSEGSFCLLPVVTFASYLNEEKQSYSWWLKGGHKETDSLLKRMAGSFFGLLKKEFIKQGFYVLDPVFQKMAEGTPNRVLPQKSSRVRDFIPLAKFYTCDIVLLGYVQVGALPSTKSPSLLDSLFSFYQSEGKTEKVLEISQYFTQFSFNVFNIKTRQLLFKLKKQFPFSVAMEKKPEKEMLLRWEGVLDSLIYQLSSYQREGSLDLSRLLISIQGPLTYAQKEQLKESLVERVPGIQNLEERLLTASREVYEAESSRDMRSIAKQLKALSLPKFVIQVKGYRKRELEIYAKKRKQ